MICVSGGGTNLQAIIDAIESGKITNTEIALVISNKENAYALERAAKAGIASKYISPKQYESKDEYGCEMAKIIKDAGCELVVLAGFLVVLPETFINEFEGRIINIHPSLIPSFCGDGFYGLKVHEKALERGVKVTGALECEIRDDLVLCVDSIECAGHVFLVGIIGSSKERVAVTVVDEVPVPASVLKERNV